MNDLKINFEDFLSMLDKGYRKDFDAATAREMVIAKSTEKESIKYVTDKIKKAAEKGELFEVFEDLNNTEIAYLVNQGYNIKSSLEVGYIVDWKGFDIKNKY
jgi:hypothetical protein